MSYDSEQSAENPVVDEGDQAQQDVDGDRGAAETDAADEGRAGTADPGKKFREMEISEEEQREIEEERQRRLDPDNRPPNAEVDNTGRTFEDGEFKD